MSNRAKSNPHYLLKENSSTNFIYALKNMEIDQKSSMFLNNNYNAKEILAYIRNKGGKVEFVELKELIFHCNLQLIETLLPKILAELILISYETNELNMDTLLEELVRRNPLNFPSLNKRQFYLYKVNYFLLELHGGMTSTKIWDGKKILNKDSIKYRHQNLIQHTRLERLFIESNTKFIFEKNGQYFVKLNLQIRFR